MFTSRFNKEEASLQKDYMIGKVKKRRLIVFAGAIAGMMALYFVMVLFLEPYKFDPFFFPLFPSVLAFLIFGAVFLGVGAYFKRNIFQLSDPEVQPMMRTNYGRIALVWLVCFLIVFVMVLPLTQFFPGDANYAESFSKDEKDSPVESYLKLEYEGADNFGTVHTEITVTSQNNVPVDFFLMKKTDADPYNRNNTEIDFTRALVAVTNATSFKNTGTNLDPSKYTLLIINSNPDAASIHYLRLQRTSDELTLVVLLFFLAYMGIAAGWFAAARKMGTGPAPVPLPPGPGPSPGPAGATYRPGMPEQGYRPGAPERQAGAMPAPRPMPASAPEPGAIKIPVTCPGCGTAFDVMKGAGPLRIQCPACRKEGTLGAGSPAMPPQAPRPAPAPTLPAPAQLPPALVTAPLGPAAPPAPAGPVPKRNMSCPRCKTVFPIDAIEGPQQIKCPSCGKEGTIGKKPQAPAAPPAAPAPAPEAPPAPAPAPQLPPAIIIAPAPAAPAVRTPGPAPAAPAGGRMIGCPQCKKPFAVTDPTRPIKVRCPSCGKEGLLKK